MTGAVRIDLSVEPASAPSRDRKQLSMLEACPDGARVIVDIGQRTYVSQDAAIWIHDHADRLLIEIVGAYPDAVSRFVQAARAGDWSVVA